MLKLSETFFFELINSYLLFTKSQVTTNTKSPNQVHDSFKSFLFFPLLLLFKLLPSLDVFRPFFNLFDCWSTVRNSNEIF